MTDWKVGQQVAITSGFTREVTLHTVKRVLKRWIELDDGSRWDMLGRRYPRIKGHGGSAYCAPATPAHREAVARQRAVRQLGTLVKDLGGITTSRLLAACVALDCPVEDPRYSDPF